MSVSRKNSEVHRIRRAARLAKDSAEFEKTRESMQEFRRKNERWMELMIKHREDVAKVARCMRDSNGTFAPLADVQRLHALGLLEKISVDEHGEKRPAMFPGAYWLVWSTYEEDGTMFAEFLSFREDFSPITYEQRHPEDYAIHDGVRIY